MSIRFTHGRLHVGYRAKDWSNVWYEPDGTKNEEGEAEILLYKLTTGKAQSREPMDGEIKWHPPFDIKNCESDKARERGRMQKQFLTDAHEYLAEKDPETIRTMEEELDRPGFSRWQTWFKEAKKFKKTQMQQRDYRRRSRMQKARVAGASEAEIRKQVNSDTSDSAYESDENRAGRQTTDMPPPPSPNPNKRKSANDRSKWQKPDKRRRMFNSILDRVGDRRSNTPGTPRMSGGLGSRGVSQLSNRNTDVEEEDEEEVDHNSIMDVRDPNGQPSLGFGIRPPWNFDEITPDSGARVRGRSVGSFSGRYSQIGTQPGRDQRNSSSNQIRMSDEEDSEIDENMMRYAREQSITEHNGGMSDDEALQRAIRESMEPQATREADDVLDSIEERADDS